MSFAVVLVHAQTPVWTQFPNSPPGTANRNDDISFVDLTNGWSARGTNGIYRTTNCGQSWFSITPHLVTNVAHFRSIDFASPTRGWAGNLGPGAYDGTVTDTNLLYETFDGGNTWGIVQAINNSGMKGFCAMHIKDDQHIYGVGRVRGPAFFAKSEDGGNNWFVTNLTAAGVMGGLMDVYFMNTNLGFTVGMDTNLFTLDQTAGPPYYGSIARTTNGGLNWQVMATVKVPYSYFWKMSWPTTNIGYVSLQQNTNYSSFVFYKTTDGGQTWVSNGIPLSTLGTSSFELQGIGFVSTNEGWLGGGALSPPNNFIHTTNGGLTWTAMGYIPLAAAISPAATNVPAGSNMTFSATAYGTAPMPFQWQHNGTNIAGGTTNSYTLANITADNAGSYTLVVSDFTGSATSSVATLTVISNTAAPVITTQPQSQVVNPGASATFNVSANGAAPLSYQWLFNGTNLVGATNTVYTQTNVQAANTGNYSVVVTNSSGNVTSSVALLALSFLADFDSYATPSIVTNVGTTDGYKIFFGADSGPVDFKAIFGFDYSTVTLPTNIPSAPHSIGGTTKGLYLSVNKDATGIAAGVDLYPTNIFVAGNFSLKFDMWLNWSNTGSATEHALFGINHSGNVTNRVTQITSDGLFFAVDGDGNVANTSTGERDFSVFHGAGAGAIPVLMTTGNTVFGPTLPLGNNFDNNDPGFITLFPSKMVPGYATLAGSAGLRWVSGEVRQENNLITCLLNGVAIAQYTNTYGYTNGMVLIGYNDIFASLGTTNNFVIFDNVRVEGIVYAPVKILSPQLAGSNFSFSLGTEAYESYTVQWTTNLLSPNWTDYTNFMGSGSTDSVAIPLPSNNSGAQYFRVSRP
ncbi:MAG: immunoglobulin domain-containing protein [Verrucomicrobia bacterium]|nr:immunoglobulin domain-containing protein [Verrucomicrobiota bacterium]